MTEQDIIDLILITDGYTMELTTALLADNRSGCMNVELSAQINQLNILKSQLSHKTIDADYGKETQELYACLLDAVSAYSGASISLDPNSNTPDVSIIVPMDVAPAWFDFSWSDMEVADQDGDGARYTYINPILIGWNPSLQTGTTLLYLGFNYDLYAGGIVRLKAGYGIYSGQSIRADNFQPYAAPPLPVNLPVITVQPNSTYSSLSGGTLSISVTATNATSYQWQKDGVNISGATGSTFSKSNLQLSDAGVYKVVVSNSNGSINSTNATVSVATGYFISNNTYVKSDGVTPSIGNVDIQITFIAGIVGISAYSTAGPAPVQTINIQFASASPLMLGGGSVPITLYGNNVNNLVDLATMVRPNIAVYNNN